MSVESSFGEVYPEGINIKRSILRFFGFKKYVKVSHYDIIFTYILQGNEFLKLQKLPFNDYHIIICFRKHYSEQLLWPRNSLCTLV